MCYRFIKFYGFYGKNIPAFLNSRGELAARNQKRGILLVFLANKILRIFWRIQFLKQISDSLIIIYKKM